MAGCPVLLVHGFASSFERDWREPGWVDLLVDAGRTVIELHLPGQCARSEPDDPEVYAALQDTVAAAVPEGTVVDAIGFSSGARLVLEVAAAHPERFERLVVAGLEANTFDDYAIAPQGTSDPAPLGSLHRPVLVVVGDREVATPVEALLSALPDAQLVILAGADNRDTPTDFRFVDAAFGFLGSPRTTRQARAAPSGTVCTHGPRSTQHRPMEARPDPEQEGTPGPNTLGQGSGAQPNPGLSVAVDIQATRDA
jgi:pimeloyl-ACP methyl ester carboxylesterase